MSDDTPVEMDQSEIDSFLEATKTGVLSLSTPSDEPPYSIPVSYGYDPVESEFYFRLATDSGSGKGQLAGRNVSFVTYAHGDENWESVVAHGDLERTTNEEIALDTLQGLERVDIPIVDIFGEPTSEVEFEFFRLVPDELTGRREEPMGQ